MLPAQHRLRRSDEFADAIRRGARSRSPRIVVHYHPGSTRAEPARVGFVVSRAVGGAVQRNLVKRRLRAAVAGEVSDLPDGSRVVVRALPAALAASYTDLRDDVRRCLRSVRHREVRR